MNLRVKMTAIALAAASTASIAGTAYAANINGNNSANTINGTAYADTIHGYGGSDTINGNSGNDTIYGGYGNDYMRGGTGVDRFYGSDGNDYIAALNPSEKAYMGAGWDIVNYYTSTSIRGYVDCGSGTSDEVVIHGTGLAPTMVGCEKTRRM